MVGSLISVISPNLLIEVRKVLIVGLRFGAVGGFSSGLVLLYYCPARNGKVLEAGTHVNAFLDLWERNGLTFLPQARRPFL